MIDLIRHSINVIRNGQSENGAYIACPNMADYAYSWFRHGTFIAYAMDLYGEHDSAHAFYDWAAGVVIERESIVMRAVEKTRRGEALVYDDYLHTRYTLDGKDGVDEWPNFQLDGFGTLLWGMIQHITLNGLPRLSAKWEEAGHLLAHYLGALWRLPNYDCWEEFGDQVHPHTLAAIYRGLADFAAHSDKGEYLKTAQDVHAFILEEGVNDKHFVKYIGMNAVDASLLGLAVPYQVVGLEDPLMKCTVEQIEAKLRVAGGGVHRYSWDTYYGGGEWILLSAWLAWYYVGIGDRDQARALQEWIASQAAPNGDLPEQTPHNLIDPTSLEPWIHQRGPIATPLLWSHAMLMIVEHGMRRM